MSRTRSRARQAAFTVISVLALAFFSGGGALAATHATTRHGARPGEPVATSVRLHVLALLNGWAPSQSQYGSGDPRVAIQNGVVYLSGSMHQATPGLERFATLPRRFRPSRNLWLPVYTFGGAVGSIEIAASGRMTASGTEATAYTSLAGISFPVTSVSLHNLSLVNGWVAAPAFLGGTARAGIQNGVVYLAGAVKQPSGTNNHFASLPRAFRPAHNMWLPIFTSGGLIGSLEIASSGRMYAFGGGVTGYTGLAGISFPANS